MWLIRCAAPEQLASDEVKRTIMTVQDYLRILRRRGWIIVAGVLLAGLAAFGVSSLQQEMYRATVQVSTVPARPDLGAGQHSQGFDA